jgi:hypothetical protein
MGQMELPFPIRVINEYESFEAWGASYLAEKVSYNVGEIPKVSVHHREETYCSTLKRGINSDSTAFDSL